MLPTDTKFHPGSLVNFVLGKQHQLNADSFSGVVISTRETSEAGFPQQFVTIEYRRDLIGAVGRIEKESLYVYSTLANADRLSTGRVGRGKEIGYSENQVELT